jgi:hypothetical protein
VLRIIALETEKVVEEIAEKHFIEHFFKALRVASDKDYIQSLLKF